MSLLSHWYTGGVFIKEIILFQNIIYQQPINVTTLPDHFIFTQMYLNNTHVCLESGIEESGVEESLHLDGEISFGNNDPIDREHRDGSMRLHDPFPTNRNFCCTILKGIFVCLLIFIFLFIGLEIFAYLAVSGFGRWLFFKTPFLIWWIFNSGIEARRISNPCALEHHNAK